MRGLVTLLLLLLIATILSASFAPAGRAQTPNWIVSETLDSIRLFVAPGVSSVHVDKVRRGIRGFNTYSREALGRPLREDVRVYVFPDGASRLLAIQHVLGLSMDEARGRLGIEALGTSKGCLDCSGLDNKSVWMRLDEECIQRLSPFTCSPAFIAAHALAHKWQIELGSFGRDNRGRPFGKDPVWLAEGVADFVGFRALDVIGEISWNEALAYSRTTVRRSPVAVPRSIAAFGMTFSESTPHFYQWNQRAQGAGYRLFAIFAHHLVQKHTARALTGYYEVLTSAQTWEEAFKLVFKSAPQEAYEEVLKTEGF